MALQPLQPPWPDPWISIKGLLYKVNWIWNEHEAWAQENDFGYIWGPYSYAPMKWISPVPTGFMTKYYTLQVWLANAKISSEDYTLNWWCLDYHFYSYIQAPIFQSANPQLIH